MKKMTLLLLMVPIILNANDTIQMLLESNGISTENFSNVGESVTLSGEELVNSAYQMHKKEILKAYTTINHESEAATYLEELITKMLTSNTIIDTGVTTIPHLIFDDNRFNGSAFRPSGVDDGIQHKLQHRDDIIKVKQIALDHCNQVLNSIQTRIPVFTAPQNLVDILLHVNRANLTYTLHDGSTFHCITALHAL